MRVKFIKMIGLVGILLTLGSAGYGDDQKGKEIVRVVVLGDSITKGVRTGVAPEETFAAVAERALKAEGIEVEIQNMGIGGERTDQALKRLDAVIEQRPKVVTVMYGTNDSYVDQGAKTSRMSREAYKSNLKAIVSGLLGKGIKPILMTEPRWADDASPNGLGENPNLKLAPYMEACREVAAESLVPLVDHFAKWTEAGAKGQKLADWTTDGCHPNPKGHRELAAALKPALVEAVKPKEQASTDQELPATKKAFDTGGPVRVVCFGDSVTGVYYHTGSRRAYTDMLGIALQKIHPQAKISTINAGISGNTTKDALARIDRDVLSKKPTLVTVMFGLNDMVRVPLDDYRKNLGEIAKKCRDAGAEVLFCTPNNVITTTGRPSERLVEYCNAMRAEGKRLGVPVCDVYEELEAFKARKPLDWRLLMSDEIHPNMDGHKRVAESIARTITGKPADLSAVPPPSPVLPRTGERLARGELIRILAMPPLDEWIGPALKAAAPGARVEITRWPTDGKSLGELEKDAKDRVRPMSPDLVLLSVPRSAKAEDLENFIHSQAWIMNSSLNFGPGGWDCLVVHPSVIGLDPSPEDHRDELIRRLVKAQDLTLIDRGPEEKRPGLEILQEWLRSRPWRVD